MSSEVLTIRVRPELKSQLDQLGQTLQRSKSYLAEQAIARYIKDNAWQIAELAQAEQEINAGQFISGSEVEQYLDSWGSENELSAPKPQP